jgi:hypothetical protein
VDEIASGFNSLTYLLLLTAAVFASILIDAPKLNRMSHHAEAKDLARSRQSQAYKRRRDD